MVRNMSEDRTDRIIELLEEILKWVKFQGWQNVKGILSEVLGDDMSKLIYHYSDGKSSREIAEKVSVSHQTVTNYWKKWAKIGIVEPLKVHRGIRYKRVFSLEDFGIEVPEVKEPSEGEESE